MEPKLMDSHLLGQIGRAIYGSVWIPVMAYDLAIDRRTIERWADGSLDIPGGMLGELAHMLNFKAEQLDKAAAIYTKRAQAMRLLEKDTMRAAEAADES